LPDLNLVDYKTWSILQDKLLKTRIADLYDLKHRIRTEWAKLDHAVIAAACISGVVIFQLVSRRVVVISSTAFNSDIMFFVVTAAFELFF